MGLKRVGASRNGVMSRQFLGLLVILIICGVVLLAPSHSISSGTARQLPHSWESPSVGKGNCLGDCSRVRSEMPSDTIKRYQKENWTRAVEEIAGDDTFFRVESHAVSLPSEAGKIDGWMYGAVPDMINVLVHDEKGKYIIFEQTKYAIPGQTLAIIGGYVKAGEDPESAGRREVLEELSMACSRMVLLGAFKVDANRGFGTVTSFLGDGCKSTAGPDYDDSDLEKQQKKVVTREELLDHVLHNRFKELKWTNTVALALLHLQQPSHLSGIDATGNAATVKQAGAQLDPKINSGSNAASSSALAAAPSQPLPALGGSASGSVAIGLKPEVMVMIPGFKTKFRQVKEGSGMVVKQGVTVKVHATGTVKATGRKFWSTKDSGQQPFTYQAAKGKGCLGMKVGEIRMLDIPAEEGYGAKGFPAWGIPPNGGLLFEIEVLEVE